MRKRIKHLLFHQDNPGLQYACLLYTSFTPIFQQLLLTVGWRTAFLVMAAFIAVLALPGALSVLCLKPSRKGLLP